MHISKLAHPGVHIFFRDRAGLWGRHVACLKSKTYETY